MFGKRRFSHFSVSFVMLLLMTLGASGQARASQIVTTIAGSVLQGTDTSGNPSGLFALPHTDLTGRNFLLTFTFDDTKGTESDTFCCAPSPVLAKSDRSGSGASSPGNAVLEIGGVAYTYPTSTASEVYRTGGPLLSSAYYYVSVQDQTINDSNVIALVYPDVGTILTPDVNWETSFSDFNLGGQGVYSFNINVKTSSGYLSASGTLEATSITVVGLSPAAVPEPGTYAMFGAGLMALGARGRRKRRSAMGR